NVDRALGQVRTLTANFSRAAGRRMLVSCRQQLEPEGLMRTRRWVIASLAFAMVACTPNEAFRKTAAIPTVACKADSAAALPEPCRTAITETTVGYDRPFAAVD